MQSWPDRRPICRRCRKQWRACAVHFEIVQEAYENEYIRARRFAGLLADERDFMTGGTFGQLARSRCHACIRTYTRGKWAGWKGYGRRRAQGAADKHRYTHWYIEPEGRYKVEGYEAARTFRDRIAEGNLRTAVNVMRGMAQGPQPSEVTVEWLLSEAQPRLNRRRIHR